MVDEGIRTISKLLSNQILDFTNPGFVISRFGGFGNVYKRTLLFPEDLLCLVEEYLIKRYGEEGEKLLYSVGKDFAFNFGDYSNFPTIKNASEEDIKSLAFNFLKFIGSIWCENLTVKDFNVKKKTAEVIFKNFIVFRKNGLGYSIMDGATTGFFDFFINDDSREGSRKVLSKSEVAIHVGDSTFNIPSKNYHLNVKENFTLNSPNEIKKPSLNDLIKNGLVIYKNNKFVIEGNVFFQCEINFLYILELKFKERGCEEVLFDAGFNFSKLFLKNLLKDNKEKLSFSSDFFSALGFGDVNFFHDHVVCKSFPWSPLINKIDLMLFKGMFSGILSLAANENISLKTHSLSITNEVDVIFK